MKKGNILLIQHKVPYSKLIPLSLLVVSQPILKNGFNVTILDQRCEDKFYNKLAEFLKEKWICIGLTCITGENSVVYEISRFIKKYRPEIPIILGGPHATILPEQTLQCPYIDFVLIGRSEENFLKLVQSISEKKNYSDIENIGSKNGKKLIINISTECRKYKTYTKIPYCLTSKYASKYPIISIESSFGCRYHCSFCVSQIINTKFSLRATADIIQLIKEALKFKKNGMLSFIDDSFFENSDRITNIFRALARQKISFIWGSNARVNHISNTPDDTLSFLKRCGLNFVAIGIESGSNKILRILNKEITTNQIIQTNRKLAKLEITPMFMFIAGIPTESPDDLSASMHLIDKLKRENKNAKFAVTGYMPYPQTPLYPLALKKGFIPPKSFKEWGSEKRYFNYNQYKILMNYVDTVNKKDR